MAAASTFDDFTPRRRAVIILIFGGLWTLGSFATDLFLPAMPAAADALGASESAVALSVTTFLIGLGLGQLIAGPVSDGRGRRPTLLVGLVVFTASALVCIVAPSVEVLIVMRLVQGMAAAFGLAIPNAMVTDYARGREAARLFSWIVIIGGVAPLVASLTGAQMLRLLGWRGPFVALTAISVFALVCVALWLPESLPRERRSTGGLRTALRTMARLTRDGRFMGYTFTGAFVYMAFFAYLGGSSFVFQHLYGVSPTTYSILFAVNARGDAGGGPGEPPSPGPLLPAEPARRRPHRLRGRRRRGPRLGADRRARPLGPGGAVLRDRRRHGRHPARPHGAGPVSPSRGGRRPRPPTSAGCGSGSARWRCR